ncbi:hypothetical protein NQ318_014777 [Aromia moschata]|uniref:Transposase n=1 Tax=Aromia moschata TaxID=1265417 RepID=A0AAV8ZBL6_9CUCU|nr:hypothetical protein NQ318_014777 [Aromia moschata]
MSLSEKDRMKITMTYGYGDRRRTTVKVCVLFNEAYQFRSKIARSTVSKIVGKCREHVHVRNLLKAGHQAINADTQLDILVRVGENPHSSSRQIDLDMKLSHITILNVLHRHHFTFIKFSSTLPNLTDTRYLQFLQQEVIPTLIFLYPNATGPGHRTETRLLFGDQAYLITYFDSYMDNIFPQRWVGQRGTRKWPLVPQFPRDLFMGLFKPISITPKT